MERWNRTDEIMPDEGERVLVYTEHPMFGDTVTFRRDITIGKHENNKWICANYIGNRVVAWMKLPAVPEEV